MGARDSVTSLRKRLPLAIILALIMVLSVVVAVLALAPSDFNAADGDLVVYPPPPVERDWESLGIVCPAGPGGGDGCSVDEPSGQDDNAFGEGAKEDSTDPAVVFGSIPPNKSDLYRLYIASEQIGGKDFLYLGWVRVNDPTGTTNMDFELNQNQCVYDEQDNLVEGSVCSANGVTPARTAGDLLIKYDLAQGGTVPDLGYHVWLTEAYALADPDIPDSAGDACEANNKFPCWGTVQQLELNANFEGAINDPDAVYDPIIDETLDPRTFGEAAVNLTDAGIFPEDSCLNYGSAFVKSRSSDAFTAELKDFIAPIPVTISNCGSIVVGKSTLPTGATQEFPFQASWLGDGSEEYDFTLTDLETYTDNAVEPGTYSVSELVPAGWDLKQVFCDSSNGDEETADNIDLQTGETVTCIFINEKDSNIVVEKMTDPAGATQEFPFQASWLGDGSEEYDFLLSDNEQHDSGDIDPGTYSVSELVPSGWDIYDVACTSSNGDEETEDNISLQAGETVTCTFYNQQDSKIIVEKQTDPAGATQEFPFQASWLGDGSEEYDFLLSDNEQHDSGDIDPGTYSVSEVVPAGWDLEDVTCTSSKGDTETEDSISLQAGETVTCVFSNQQDSKIIVEKLTAPPGADLEFPFQVSWLGDGSEEYDFLLSHGEQHDSGDLDPGTYSVSEVVPVGWGVKDVTCTSSKGDEETEDSISLQAGETVTCVFTNETREYRVTAGYEDLEVDDPLMDYDYNDWEIQIDITFDESRIDFFIEPLGRGGVNDHVFHIAIPGGKLTVDGEYTLTLYDENGVVISTETGDFDASAGEDFIVIPCTCEAFPPSGTVVNVYEGIYQETQRTAEISIVLDGEEPNMGDLFHNGVGNHGEGLFFDPYIYVQESGEEIHQNDFRLLTVQLERSDPAWKWPEENVCLSNAYPLVTGFPPTFFFGEEWWAYPSENGCTYGDGEVCELSQEDRACKAIIPPNHVFVPLVLK